MRRFRYPCTTFHTRTHTHTHTHTHMKHTHKLCLKSSSSHSVPYPEGPPVQRSEACLDHGSTSTYQSPSFRRIHDAPETVPSALGPRPPRPPSPPSEEMKDVRIDEGNVVKTSYKPPREFTSNQPVPKLFKWRTTKTIVCCEQSDH